MKIFCKVCGIDIVYTGKGRKPQYCKKCYIEHRRKYKRKHRKENEERYKLTSKGSGVGDKLLLKQINERCTEILEDSDFPTTNQAYVTENASILVPEEHDRKLNGSYELEDNGNWKWISDEEDKKIEKELKDLKKLCENWEYWI